MSYASIDRCNWPLGWEELEYVTNELRRYSLDYYVVTERYMFGLEDFRFAICKRTPRGGNRDVIGTYTDMAEVIGMIRLLIGTEKDARSAETALVDSALRAVYKF